MTIASEIQRIKDNIANTYTALGEKGATMPEVQDSANLADTVATVTTGGGGGGDSRDPLFDVMDAQLLGLKQKITEGYFKSPYDKGNPAEILSDLGYTYIGTSSLDSVNWNSILDSNHIGAFGVVFDNNLCPDSFSMRGFASYVDVVGLPQGATITTDGNYKRINFNGGDKYIIIVRQSAHANSKWGDFLVPIGSESDMYARGAISTTAKYIHFCPFDTSISPDFNYNPFMSSAKHEGFLGVGIYPQNYTWSLSCLEDFKVTGMTLKGTQPASYYMASRDFNIFQTFIMANNPKLNRFKLLANFLQETEEELRTNIPILDASVFKDADVNNYRYILQAIRSNKTPLPFALDMTTQISSSTAYMCGRGSSITTAPYNGNDRMPYPTHLYLANANYNINWQAPKGNLVDMDSLKYFANSAQTVSGKTLTLNTVTYNVFASTCPTELALLQSKGWTVTGTDS